MVPGIKEKFVRIPVIFWRTFAETNLGQPQPSRAFQMKTLQLHNRLSAEVILAHDIQLRSRKLHGIYGSVSLSAAC